MDFVKVFVRKTDINEGTLFASCILLICLSLFTDCAQPNVKC